MSSLDPTGDDLSSAANIILPANYTTPQWPGLGDDQYLYLTYDIWYFITVWTLIFSTTICAAVSLWAYFVFRKHPWALGIPVVFTAVGAINGFLGGTVVSLSMALLYQAGSLKMSTWIALAWGFLYAMFYVLESFSTVSSLL